MNIAEMQEACKRLQASWRFFFGDLGFNAEPAPRQYQVWINLYGLTYTELGFQRANVFVSKQQKEGRRVSLDDLVRYASACARNLKQEAANVDTNTASK